MYIDHWIISRFTGRGTRETVLVQLIVTTLLTYIPITRHQTTSHTECHRTCQNLQTTLAHTSPALRMTTTELGNCNATVNYPLHTCSHHLHPNTLTTHYHCHHLPCNTMAQQKTGLAPGLELSLTIQKIQTDTRSIYMRVRTLREKSLPPKLGKDQILVYLQSILSLIQNHRQILT